MKQPTTHTLVIAVFLIVAAVIILRARVGW